MADTDSAHSGQLQPKSFMLKKTSSMFLFAVALAGCADPCPDGVGGNMGVRDGEIWSQDYGPLGSVTTQFGTLEQPDEALLRCENIASLRFFGPFKGPLTAFDHVNSLGLLEFMWIDIDELDAFPSLTSLGDLVFRGFNPGGPDPDRGEDDPIPPDAELLRVARIGGFPKLEHIRSVRHYGSGTTGDWVGFGSLQRIDSFDFSFGSSATTFEGLSTVESMGELIIDGAGVETLDSFRSLGAVDADVKIGNMPFLRTLGMNALESVGGDLSVQQVSLREWNGMNSLASVGGEGTFYDAACLPQTEFDLWAEGVSFNAGYTVESFGYLIGEANCEQ